MKKVIGIVLIILVIVVVFWSFKYFNNKDNDGVVNIGEDDKVVFKDKQLDMAIKEVTGISNISVSDASGVKTLILDNKNIKDLDGLEYFSNLEELSMNFNEITDISKLKSMKRLKYLSLSNNRIQDISVLKNLQELEKVFLYSNNIVDVSSLINLPNLTNMPVLYNNNILNLDVLEDSLERIRINSLNNFYTVEFDGNTSVYKRDFSNMMVSGCDDTYVVCMSNMYDLWNKEEIRTYKEAMKEARNFIKSNINDNMSDLEKELVIADYLVKKMRYESTDGVVTGMHALYYPLVLGYGQCHNYAQAFNMLASMAGLESYSAYAGAYHEWNIVRIDEVFYHLDLTWGDIGDSLDYRFVNRSTESIDLLHNFSFNYPLDIKISDSDMEF